MADNAELLKILQSHGEQFLNCFSLSEPTSISRKRKRKPGIIPTPNKSSRLAVDDENDDEDEWGGIIEHSAAERNEDLDVQTEIEHEHDDNFRADSSSSSKTNVVIFNDFLSNPQSSQTTSKTLMKAFMSSKISKLRQDIPGPSTLEETEVEDDNDRSNAQNDALLHRLVHTELLSAYSNPDLNLSAAQRRKALSGRVLELSGGAVLGKGQKSVVEKERNKAAKRVRDGLVEKQKARAKQELEEAKNLGNYHPTIKKLFGSSVGPASAKRDRGLGMGVGKFSGGFLKLSKGDISLAQGGQKERNSHCGRPNSGRRKSK